MMSVKVYSKYNDNIQLFCHYKNAVLTMLKYGFQLSLVDNY